MSFVSFPEIFSADVRVYSSVVPLSEEDAARLSSLAIELPEKLKSAVEKRRDEFLAGRYCAIRAMESVLKDTGGVHIGIDTEGAPVWPKGWVGSITHTRGYVAAAVAQRTKLAGLGLDVEKVISQERAASVQGHVLTAAEREMLHEIKTLLPEEFVTLVFSAKESLYKCLRPVVGKFFGFQDAELFEMDVKGGSFRVRLKKTIGAGFESDWTGCGQFKIVNSCTYTAFELRSNS